MRLFFPATLLLAFILAACGGGAGDSGSDTLTVEGQMPADSAAGLREEPLTPSTLKDPRMEALTNAERRILQDYVQRGIRRDSLEDPDSGASLGGWLDSNLTVGEVIALYHGTEEIDPLPPEPLPQSPPQSPTQRPEEGG